VARVATMREIETFMVDGYIRQEKLVKKCIELRMCIDFYGFYSSAKSADT
jgi:hypothetical protein